MTESKAKNISAIPIDGFSNIRVTSLWSFLQSVSLQQHLIVLDINIIQRFCFVAIFLVHPRSRGWN